MRLREALKLNKGDIITCRAKECGCDPKKKVVIARETFRCGCIGYFHSGNSAPFLFDGRKCPYIQHTTTWTVNITGRMFKLVRRAK